MTEQPRSEAKPDPIIGARQAAEAGPAEKAPIVLWSYLAALVEEYDSAVARLTAERDRLATDRAVLLAVVKEINVAHSETVSRTGYTPAGVLPSVKQACKGCGGHYMPPCIEKQATDEALAAVSGTGQRHWSEDHGWHEFAPGVDADGSVPPDPRWCNVCGEAAGTGQPEPQREPMSHCCFAGCTNVTCGRCGKTYCANVPMHDCRPAAAPVVAVPGQPREDEQR